MPQTPESTPDPAEAPSTALTIEDMNIQPLSRMLLAEMLAAIGSNGQQCCSHKQCSNESDKVAAVEAVMAEPPSRGG